MLRKNKIRGLVQVTDGYYDVEYELLEEGGYLARVPALHAATFGDTLKEAQAMVADMVGGWLDTARAHDLPIPEPKPLVRVKMKRAA